MRVCQVAPRWHGGPGPRVRTGHLRLMRPAHPPRMLGRAGDGASSGIRTRTAPLKRRVLVRLSFGGGMERPTGFEPVSPAWQPGILAARRRPQGSGPRGWIRTNTSQRLGLGPLPGWATRGRGRGSRNRTDDLLAENQAPSPTWPYPPWWILPDSNRPLPACKTGALPAELRTRVARCTGFEPVFWS